MFKNSVIGRAKSAFVMVLAMIGAVFKPADHDPDRVSGEAGHHPRHVCRAEIGAQGQQGCIEGDQFRIAARRAPERCMTEPGDAVSLDQNVGKLGLTYPTEDPTAEHSRGRILDVGLDLGDDKMPVLDADIARRHRIDQHREAGAQPGAQASQGALGTAGQAERADKDPLVAPPGRIGNQLILDSTIAQADRAMGLPVAQRALEQQQGGGAPSS